MQDKGLSEFKSFLGILQAGNDITPINFLARINGAGEVEFDFDEIVLTKETSFIKKCWVGEGSRPGFFSLSGNAEDGTEFKTENLYLNSIKSEWSEETGSRMRPVGGCSRAEFSCKVSVPAPKPTLRMHLKGFQNSGQLRSECCLGTVAMDGASSINDHDALTGYIVVQSNNEPANLTAWHAEADKAGSASPTRYPSPSTLKLSSEV